MDVLKKVLSQNNYKETNETMVDIDVDASADEKIGTDGDTPEKSDLYNDIPGSKEIAKAIECANEKNVDIKNSHILEDAVAAYQSGDDTAFDILYKEYRPKFERFAIRMKDDDAVQELSIALIKAADAYKPNAGTKFNTYFWTVAKKHIGTVNIFNHAKKRYSEHGIVSLNKKVSDFTDSGSSDIELGDCIKDESIESKADESLFRVFLENDIFPKLKKDEAKAINMLLDGYTLAQIGEACGHISAPAIHTKIRSLRNKSVSLNIKEWLENR
jgi:RNA polymerase sigma factor (sigma-70 family)